MKPYALVLLIFLQGAAALAQKPANDPPPPAESSSAASGIRLAGEKLQKALADLKLLALLPVELNGTGQGEKFIEQALLQALAAEGRQLMDSREVFRRLGVEFQLSEEALGRAAESLQVEAVIFPRVFASPQAVELHLWVVSREGKTIFEETFAIELPPPDAATPAEDTAQASPAPGSAQAPHEGKGHVPLLALAPRVRSGPGISVGFATGNVAMGVHTPAEEGQDWMITEDGQPISEARLAELAGRKDLLSRLEKAAGRYRTWRNVGIGLAISGFIATAAALPYYKQGSDQGLTAASVAVAAGTALGATGLIFWINYAQLAANAFTPFPSRHAIDLEEAQQMIEEVNQRRLKEFVPPSESSAGRLYFGLLPGPNYLGATLGGVF